MVKAKYGSSDLFRLSTLWEQRLTQRVSLSTSAEFLTASGKYEFRYMRKQQDGAVAYDTTAIRQNGDIWAVRAEANLHGMIDDGFWKLKAYTYHSERGIPGAIVNNVWRRGERQADHNTFVQGRWQKSLNERFTTQWVAKYAYYDTRYVNRDTTQLQVDNKYQQQEAYLSTSNAYDILPFWSVSLSYDLKWNHLRQASSHQSETSHLTPQNSNPYRFSHYVALASALSTNRLKMQGSVLATIVNDHSQLSSNSSQSSVLTPAFFMNVYPFECQDFSVRLYAKKSFRMPTFNDLYYTEIGSAADLVPESALQYNGGVSYDHQWNSGVVRRLHLQTDVYYNSVHDKIVAYPKGQQFRWTMLNLGKVHIKGIDVEGELTTVPLNGLQVTGRLQYTYQDARDVTNSADTYYRHQIPYIPWHSGSAIVNVQYGAWDVNYSFIYAGERYNQQENIPYNYMQPWYTSDVSIARQLWVKNIELKAMLEVNNLFSQDYDVILNYPMPKRNYTLTIKATI